MHVRDRTFEGLFLVTLGGKTRARNDEARTCQHTFVHTIR